MRTYYTFKYKGRQQDLRWTWKQVVDHLLIYLTKGSKISDYEIIRIEETNLGEPQVSLTVKNMNSMKEPV